MLIKLGLKDHHFINNHPGSNEWFSGLKYLLGYWLYCYSDLIVSIDNVSLSQCKNENAQQNLNLASFFYHICIDVTQNVIINYALFFGFEANFITVA